MILDRIADGSVTADEDGNVYVNGVRHPGYVGNRYKVICLGYKGDQCAVNIHKIVWIFFNGDYPKDMQIDHINRDKLDNRLCNLRVVTPKENSNNRPSTAAELNPSAKLTWELVREIRIIFARGVSCVKIAKDFGISDISVLNIVRNKTWKDPEYQLDPNRIDKFPNRIITREEATFLFNEYRATKNTYGFFKKHANRLGVREDLISQVAKGKREPSFYLEGTL